jgi:phosphoglycolate phosphatase-like HAD superfamily hydrolase
MRPTVLLWDIDGTLISTAGVGRRAIVATFERRFGRGDVLSFPFDGMTDPVILRQGLMGLGFEAEEAEREIPATLAEYLLVLEDMCASAGNFSIHAGVEAALSLVGGRPGVAVGLGTGNVEAGARLKLERVGLFRHFGFGGYGSDHGDRARLLAVGAERGAARLGLPRESCRVVVIGDTPKDIAAARAIGAESLAVATGSFKVAALREHGATHAFENLAEPQAAGVLLEG